MTLYTEHPQFPDFKSASLCPLSAGYADKHCSQLNAESAFMCAAQTLTGSNSVLA